MKEIVHILNISRKPLFQASTSLITEIFTVARTAYKPDLLLLKSICPLPDFTANYQKTFSETALERAADIWRKHAVAGQLNLLWSGGIDSTVSLIALLQTAASGQNLRVYCNVNSINENPFLYSLLLKQKNVSFENSSKMPDAVKMTVITGELGDQIFGSDLLFRIVNNFGFSKLREPYEEVLPKLFNIRCGNEFGNFLYERYRPIAEEAPFKIRTAFDFIWWWNLTQKWQCVKFRKDCLLSPAIKAVHFFESDNFQRWSVHNHDKKIQNTVQSYKMPAKEFIFEFDKNADYKLHKRKYGSPFGNKFYFFAIYDDGSKVDTWKECDQLINELSPEI